MSSPRIIFLISEILLSSGSVPPSPSFSQHSSHIFLFLCVPKMLIFNHDSVCSSLHPKPSFTVSSSTLLSLTNLRYLFPSSKIQYQFSVASWCIHLNVHSYFWLKRQHVLFVSDFFGLAWCFWDLFMLLDVSLACSFVLLGTSLL